MQIEVIPPTEPEFNVLMTRDEFRHVMILLGLFNNTDSSAITGSPLKLHSTLYGEMANSWKEATGDWAPLGKGCIAVTLR